MNTLAIIATLAGQAHAEDQDCSTKSEESSEKQELLALQAVPLGQITTTEEARFTPSQTNGVCNVQGVFVDYNSQVGDYDGWLWPQHSGLSHGTSTSSMAKAAYYLSHHPTMVALHNSCCQALGYDRYVRMAMVQFRTYTSSGLPVPWNNFSEAYGDELVCARDTIIASGK